MELNMYAFIRLTTEICVKKYAPDEYMGFIPSWSN
jgi:hypothetical protein